MKNRLWFMKLFIAIGVPVFIIGITLFGATLYLRRRNVLKNIKHSMSIEEIENLWSDVKVNQILNKQIIDNGYLDEEGVILELKMKMRGVNRKLNNMYTYFDSNILPRVKRDKIPTHSIIDGRVVDAIDSNKYPDIYNFFVDKNLLIKKRDLLVKKLDTLLVDPNLNQKKKIQTNWEATYAAMMKNTRLSNEYKNNQIKLSNEPAQNSLLSTNYFAKYSIIKSHYSQLTGSNIPTIEGLTDYFIKKSAYLKREAVDLNNDLADYNKRLDDLYDLRLKY